ncbi:MAG: HlyD family efflux transporter periplasmic adaptor subunit [Acidobacteria bacterium]|nr:HlyD family efflux transporter periplasmic adaptor subunit [Acidobacteriota bacterium]
MRLQTRHALVLLPVALALAGCGRGTNGKAIHASGHIEATEVRLAAKVGGRLLDLPFQEGDAVAAGAVVARFETVDAEHELARAAAELDAADARLRLLLAGSRTEDVRQAEAELARSRAELEAAERDLARFEGLAERGTATIKARDDARTRREAASRAVKALEAVRDKLVAGPRREEIEGARAQRAAVEASIATIRQRVADATVVAPRAGVITQRAAEPGEVLPPGALLAVLTDLATPWLTVYVDEPSLAGVRIGDTVTVRVDGRAESFTGRVSFVAEAAEFTPKNVQTPEERAKLVFKVKVLLDNAAGVFKPGMPADAYFTPTLPPSRASSVERRRVPRPTTGLHPPGRGSSVESRGTDVALAGALLDPGLWTLDPVAGDRGPSRGEA